LRLISVSLISGDFTLSQNWESEPIYIGHAIHFSAMLQFSGVPDGTFRLEYSNDIVEPSSNRVPSNWEVVGGSEQIVDESGTHGWQVQNAGYRWVKVSYIYTGGVGILTSATFHSKGLP